MLVYNYIENYQYIAGQIGLSDFGISHLKTELVEELEEPPETGLLTASATQAT